MLVRIEKASSQRIPEKLLDFLSELGSDGAGFGVGDIAKSGSLLEYVQALEEMSEGRNLKPFFVPMTTYWLMDSDNRVVGMSNLRHFLTEALLFRGGHIGYYIAEKERKKGYGTFLLQQTLEAAKSLGLHKVLITTGSDNIASRIIIERNGGILEDERYDPKRQKNFLRFWVDV
jgi:predicted acetyltransferase